MYYVTMTDKFMSGWGMAKSLINKLILKCNNYDEAIRVKNYATSRGDQIYINICSNKPNYYRKRLGKEYVLGNYFVQIKDRIDMPMWYD